MNTKSQSIGKIISALHRRIYARLSNRLKSYEINTGQIHFLFTLARKPGICQHDLAQEVFIDKTTATKMISSLEQSGYVQRRKDQDDQRYWHLYLTGKAESLLPKISKILKMHSREMTKNFSEQELETLFQYLDRIYNNMKDQVDGKNT